MRLTAFGSTRLSSLLILGMLVLSSCSRGPDDEALLNRADSYFEAQKYEAARIEYLNLLHTSGSNAHAIERIGLTWIRQGAVHRALPLLLKAVEERPADVELRMELAQAWFAIGELAEALSESLKVLDQDPRNGEALILMADTSLSAADTAEARKRLANIAPGKSAAYHVALAFIAQREGDLEGMERALNQALELDPESAVAHSTLATLYSFNNDPKAALEAARIAAELAPLRSSIQLRYASMLSQYRSAEEALQYVEDLIEKAKDYLPAQIFAAKLMARHGDPEKAVKALNNVLSRDPENLAAQSAMAQILADNGDEEEAITLYRELLKRFPEASGVREPLAGVLLKLGRYHQAIPLLKQALEIDSSSVEARLLLARANLKAGEPFEAIQALNPLLKSHPSLVEANMMLASAFQQTGQLDRAAQLLRANLEQPGARFMLGKILVQEGRLEEARLILEEALALAPNEPAIAYELIELDIAREDFVTAKGRIAELASQVPAWSVDYLLGKIHVAEEDWGKAVETLERSLGTRPDWTASRDLLVEAYKNNGDLHKAIQVLESQRKEDPGDLRSQMQLAQLYSKAGERRLAIRAYEALLAEHPSTVAALNNLAYLYAEESSDLELAVRLARKARTLAPSNPGVADTLGWILYRRGEYKEALSLIREAERMAKDVPVLQYHLGMALYRMGDADGAKAALLHATKAQGDFEGRDDAAETLAFLERFESLSLAELEARMKAEPKDLLASLKLGQLYQEGGRYPDAASEFQRVLRLNPDTEPALRGMAELYGGPLDDLDKAVEAALRLRELSPRNSEGVAILGSLILRQGKHAWAYDLLREARRGLGDQASPELEYHLALASYCVGKHSDAEEAMQKLANGESALQSDARLFLQLTSPDPSSSEISPGTIPEDDPLHLVAQMREASKADLQTQLTKYEGLHMRYSDFLPAQRALVAIYAQDPERREEAFTLATKVRERLPEDVELARTMGALAYSLNKLEYAVQLFEQVQRSDTLQALDLFHLGMSYLAMGDREKGTEILHEALKQGLEAPQNEAAQEALANA